MFALIICGLFASFVPAASVEPTAKKGNSNSILSLFANIDVALFWFGPVTVQLVALDGAVSVDKYIMAGVM